MERYVVSRELAERLKEAVYPQNTQWFWHFSRPAGLSRLYYCEDMRYDNERFKGPMHQRFREDNEFFATPMSDELLEQLPETIQSPRGYLWRLCIKPLGKGWSVEYENHSWASSNKSARKRIGYSDEEIEALAYGAGPFYKDKLADALAQLWLWCKEHDCLESGQGGQESE